MRKRYHTSHNYFSILFLFFFFFKPSCKCSTDLEDPCKEPCAKIVWSQLILLIYVDRSLTAINSELQNAGFIKNTDCNLIWWSVEQELFNTLYILESIITAVVLFLLCLNTANWWKARWETKRSLGMVSSYFFLVVETLYLFIDLNYVFQGLFLLKNAFPLVILFLHQSIYFLSLVFQFQNVIFSYSTSFFFIQDTTNNWY